MSNDEITTVAADYIYLILLGESEQIQKIAELMNQNCDQTDVENKKIYIATKIDVQIDCLPESDKFQDILNKDAEEHFDQDTDDIESLKKYFVMGEGVETAQCNTVGEGYVNVHMLIEIAKRDNYFEVLYPVLHFDDEANPEDLISTWVIDNNISDIEENMRFDVRLIDMVRMTNDILIYAAYVNTIS